MRHAIFLLATLVAVSLIDSGDLQAKGPKSEKDRQLEAALRKQSTKVAESFCDDLGDAAAWAASKGLSGEAAKLVARIERIHPEYSELEKVKERVARGGSSDEKVEELKEDLEKKLERAGESHARKLYDFAGKCFKAGLFSQAYDLLHRISLHVDDPRNSTLKKAQRILGFVWDRKLEKWISKWESSHRKKHFLTEEGWFPTRDQRKYEQGLRPCLGKWITGEEETRIRSRNEYNPYTVESENFVVKTLLGRKTAWEYCERLESFASAFYRFFIGYYDQVGGAKLLFKRSDTKKKHVVYIFPSRLDYLTHVKREKGNDQLYRESAGFYSSGDRISKFYYADDLGPTLKTFYHEVAHQLFAESKETSPGGSRGNNWVVEGVAVYVESWEKVDGEWRPGINTKISELQTAKEFLENSGGFSLESFIPITNEQFHKEGRGMNYALAGAFCHFLIHFDDGVYKEDFVRFVSNFYAGKVSGLDLIDELDIPDSEGSKINKLEEQFRAYMKSL